MKHHIAHRQKPITLPFFFDQFALAMSLYSIAILVYTAKEGMYFCLLLILLVQVALFMFFMMMQTELYWIKFMHWWYGDTLVELEREDKHPVLMTKETKFRLNEENGEISKKRTSIYMGKGKYLFID